MEQSNNIIKSLKDNWFIIIFVGAGVIQWAENRKDTANLQQAVISLTETVATLNRVIEEKIAKEATRLDEEDNGVRSDMERADQELHNDIRDFKELEEMRERAQVAELKFWALENLKNKE